jgi:DNA (cytosine-5)-methyltransferase 1
MTAYYNEIDPYAAQWLRNLIHAGHIAPGIVDERSIEDVFPSDLRGFTQCHFFAGIGVWSYALRLAGWGDDRPVWTGSCPCQPFSAAGKGAGTADERHLWPAFFHLIQQGKPRAVPVLGEQVASKDGLAWLDLVLADLEGEGYAATAVDLCAAGVGAPHLRQRLFWLADANGRHAGAEGLQRRQQHRQQPQDGGPRVLADTEGERCGQGRALDARRAEGTGSEGAGLGPPDSGCGSDPGPVNGFWRAADWLGCTDGFWRPVEPGASPLAHGVAGRVGKVRAYGNAINAEAARVFIQCVKETI